MPKRVLMVDASTLATENLRARLLPMADIVWAGDVASLDALAAQGWDLIICDAGLGETEGQALWARLKPRERPVFLYTDRADVADSAAWSAAGLARAFTRLQRADLVLAAEQVLLPAATGAAAPAFLLVEDSATMRQYVKEVLRRGYPQCEVLEAEDGRAALAAMKSARVSLIITDLQMPGMDGLSFVQLLRNNAVLKRKPVLVLSGAVTEEARVGLAQLEKVQVLAKPAAPEAVLNAIKSLLG